jgi:hypothetical protein
MTDQYLTGLQLGRNSRCLIPGLGIAWWPPIHENIVPALQKERVNQQGLYMLNSIDFLEITDQVLTDPTRHGIGFPGLHNHEIDLAGRITFLEGHFDAFRRSDHRHRGPQGNGNTRNSDNRSQRTASDILQN